MAEGMNRVIVMGNLGQDPELRSTQGGASVMTLSLAINESYLDANKERQQRTEWVRVVVWGKRAEGLGPQSDLRVHLARRLKCQCHGGVSATMLSRRRTCRRSRFPPRGALR